jgi:hypothetical protein
MLPSPYSTHLPLTRPNGCTTCAWWPYTKSTYGDAVRSANTWSCCSFGSWTYSVPAWIATMTTSTPSRCIALACAMARGTSIRLTDHGSVTGRPFVPKVMEISPMRTPSTSSTSGRPAPRRCAYVPVWSSPRASRASTVRTRPSKPLSTAWFEAVVHAS